MKGYAAVCDASIKSGQTKHRVLKKVTIKKRMRTYDEKIR